jgi:hypothetical protein
MNTSCALPPGGGEEKDGGLIELFTVVAKGPFLGTQAGKRKVLLSIFGPQLGRQAKL